MAAVCSTQKRWQRPQELINLKADRRLSNNSEPFAYPVTLKCPPREFSFKTLFLTGTSLFALHLWNHESTPPKRKARTEEESFDLEDRHAVASGFSAPRPQTPASPPDPSPNRLGLPRTGRLPKPQGGLYLQAAMTALPEADPYPRANGQVCPRACALTPNGRQRALRPPQPPRLLVSRPVSFLNSWRLLSPCLSPADPTSPHHRGPAPGPAAHLIPRLLPRAAKRAPGSGYRSRA